jgi:hypothetical protein
MPTTLADQDRTLERAVDALECRCWLRWPISRIARRFHVSERTVRLWIAKAWNADHPRVNRIRAATPGAHDETLDDDSE